MPLFTTPHSWHLVSITLPTPSLSAQRELNIRDRTRLSTNTLHQLHAESVVKTDTQTSKWAFPLTFNHIPFVVAVIVAVCGPVVNVEALDRSVVVTRGTILEGNGKKITLDYSNLVPNYYTKTRNFPSTNGGPCYQQMYSLPEVQEIIRLSEVK